MSGLSKIGIGLIVVISVTLAALLAQLCYVLWCRRRFHRKNLSGELADNLSSNNPYSTSTNPSSKELFYFFCWKNQSRIEPASAPPFHSDGGNDGYPDPAGDLMKWHWMYGPSRVLFTITEEEKEDSESSDHKTSSETNKTRKRVSLEEHFGAVHEQEPAPALATTMVAVDFEETPFSTPCDSPLYYTPSPSPTRELQLQRNDANLTRSPEPDVSMSVAVEVGELQRESSENGFSGESLCVGVV